MAANDPSPSPQHGARRQIRFFPDYWRRYPLWENGTDKYTMDPSDYDLSESLATRLEAWMTHWEDNFSPDHGWRSPKAKEESRRRGDALVADLRAEVSDFADVLDER